MALLRRAWAAHGQGSVRGKGVARMEGTSQAGGAARLKRRRCRVQALQGKAEGEVLPSLHCTQQGWKGSLQRVFPHIAPLLHHSLQGSFELPQTRGSRGSEGKEAGSTQHRKVPASLSLSKGGGQHAPRRAPGSPLSSIHTRQAPRTPGLSRAWQGHTHRSGAGASGHHPTKGELGPAAFSQIQRCRSSGPAH